MLVETMIGLAHRLGYRVVAEGVECPETAAILSATGCEEAQGFHFGKPMDPAQFESWLRRSADGFRPLMLTAA
jgi:EAL domain-containing protein (putative c-di-GMP-specific phosphodiesterase class I)